MIQFEKQKQYTEFKLKKIKEKIDILQLDDDICKALGAQRWEAHPLNQGYSGITVIQDVNLDGSIDYKIIIHWTRDGVNGFNVDFSSDQKLNVEKAITDHIQKIKDKK